MTKKRGRPPKVEGAEVVEAEPVPEEERFAKRPIMSNINDKITITVDKDGKKHIDCGGLTPFDVCMILKGCHQYLFNTINKELGLNGSEEGTADTPGGSDT